MEIPEFFELSMEDGDYVYRALSFMNLESRYFVVAHRVNTDEAAEVFEVESDQDDLYFTIVDDPELWDIVCTKYEEEIETQ